MEPPNPDNIARRKENAALYSVFASGALALLKLAVGTFSGSLALLSEAAHSLADTLATIITWLAIRWSGRPADKEHQYGHGKVESVAALIETGVLFALTLAVLFFALRKLATDNTPPDVSPLVIAIVIISILIDINRIRTLRRIARETGSQALAADALHFTSDLAGSFTVLIGLFATHLGFPAADSFAALIVAIFIAHTGWKLGRRALDTLMDAAPADHGERLRALASTVPGVINVSNLRARSDGHNVFADMTITVPRSLSLDEARTIKETIRTLAKTEFPNTELNLIADPVVPGSETICERILLVGRREHIPLHHLTVQEMNGRLSISFDMEVDSHATLAAAHERAETLKQILYGEFGTATEIEPHVEPLYPSPLPGQDAPPDLVRHIETKLNAAAATSDCIREIHDVRVRETLPGWIVNYHCRAPGSFTVEVVHRDMDNIEHELFQSCPKIARIVGHADAIPEHPTGAA
ncbi:MAG: cation-efflux pump [Puniceicoccales bacterium]|nr:cation-efflux pump [Puniceicoccales bacterium]